MRNLRGARGLSPQKWGQIVAPTLIIVGEEVPNKSRKMGVNETG